MPSALVGSGRPRRPPAVPAGPGAHPGGACGAGSTARGFVEVDPSILQASPGNEAHLHAFATDLAASTARRRAGSTCTPRRSSPARSCWPPARRGCSPSPTCSATASAGPCTTPSSPCSNGTGPTSPTRRLMADCAELLALAAAAGGVGTQLAFRGRTVDPFAPPERLTVAEAFARHRRHRPAGDGRRAGRRRPRGSGGSRARGRRPGRRRTTAGPTCSAACWSSGSSRGSGRAGPRSCASTRWPRRRWPGPSRTTRAWPSGSSSMPAGSSSPTASASSPTPPSSAAASRPRWTLKERLYGERYPLDEDFLAALAADAARQRHGAGLRPAGHAGHRRAHDRARALGAGGRSAPALRPR